MPIPLREDWKACAVPWNVVFRVVGTCSSCVALFTSSIACDSATPGLRSNEMVTDGSCPRWLTESGPTP